MMANVLKLGAVVTALSVLAACGRPAEVPGATDDRLVIRGELFYPERVALPSESTALVELRAGTGAFAPLLAQTSTELDGRQVPVRFELTVEMTAVPPETDPVLRGAIVSRPGPIRVTSGVRIDTRPGTVDLGALRLRPAEQTAFGAPFLCNGTTVVFGALGGREWMSVAGEVFELEPAIAASGARYVDPNDEATVFWNKGERAQVTVRGHELPECLQVTEPPLPFRAVGQEPGWLLEIAAGELRLSTDYGTRLLQAERPEPRISTDGVRYQATTADGHRLEVTVQRRICADIATGMPHPYRVRYELDGEAYTGCGGSPRSLLTGEEWTVERIADEPVIAGSGVTVQFLDEDRVAGNASCNRFTGSFDLTGEGLTFGLLATTRMACADEALNRQERRFLEVLQRTSRFEIDDEGHLLLHVPDGHGIVARR